MGKEKNGKVKDKENNPSRKKKKRKMRRNKQTCQKSFRKWTHHLKQARARYISGDLEIQRKQPKQTNTQTNTITFDILQFPKAANAITYPSPIQILQNDVGKEKKST